MKPHLSAGTTDTDYRKEATPFCLCRDHRYGLQMRCHTFWFLQGSPDEAEMFLDLISNNKLHTYIQSQSSISFEQFILTGHTGLFVKS